MRCVRQAEPTPKICEVVLTLQVQGQPGPLAQIAVGRLQRNAPMRMTAVLPVNITLPSTVRVLTAANDPQPLELTWKRCIQGACIADLELTAPNLQKLRGRSEAGQITLVDAAGRELALPLSMRGLVQALDAVNREMN
jgi:invasion protein IalB